MAVLHDFLVICWLSGNLFVDPISFQLINVHVYLSRLFKVFSTGLILILELHICHSSL